MSRLPISILALLAALVAGLLLFVAPLRAADPKQLACPNGQTVFLEGQAPANEALLVFLAGRAVGGGLTASTGNYRLPLRARERPGSYPVEVRTRSAGAVVGRFTCFVDVPIGQAPSPTAEIVVTAPRSAPPTSTPRVSPATRTPAGTPTTTATGAAATATPTPTLTGTPATATPTLTGTPATATPTATGTSGTFALVIDDVVLVDPAFPTSSPEYVEISNEDSRDVNIGGWRLVNASRTDVPSFVFPSYLFERDTTLAVYSAGPPTCDSDVENGEFCWGQSNGIWRTGDRVELRDLSGRVVSSFVVAD